MLIIGFLIIPTVFAQSLGQELTDATNRARLRSGPFLGNIVRYLVFSAAEEANKGHSEDFVKFDRIPCMSQWINETKGEFLQEFTERLVKRWKLSYDVDIEIIPWSSIKLSWNAEERDWLCIK